MMKDEKAKKMYQTEAAFEAFESVNQPEFNLACEKELPYPGMSVFPPSFLRDNARRFFDKACENIEKEELSLLCRKMIDCRCNKPIAHNYTQLYHQILKDERETAIDFIEVGIGTPNQDVPSAMGVGYPYGASLRGWRDYFTNPDMTIRGGDIDPRVLFKEERIRTGYVNQLNPSAIHTFVMAEGLADSGIDVILDDGLHEYRSNMTLLISVWPYMKKNGIYLIEDMSQSTFERNIAFIKDLALGASGAAFALPSKLKPDNRVVALQKQ